MKNNKDLLSSILKTTQMGQIGIRAVMKHAVRPELKSALKQQLQQYDSIEQEAHAIAASRGWEVSELDPIVKFMAMRYAQANLSFDRADSKIAAMMIQGNTRGMIKSLKNSHHAVDPDASVAILSQKLLDHENENIQQMQGFL